MEHSNKHWKMSKLLMKERTLEKDRLAITPVSLVMQDGKVELVMDD